MQTLRKQKTLISFLVGLLFVVALPATSQEIIQDELSTMRARIVEVSPTQIRTVPGTDVISEYQIVKIEILEGEQKGNIIELENDYIQLEKGDVFFLNRLTTVAGDEIYTIGEPDRRMVLYIAGGIFVLLVLLFAKTQGLRALLSLAGSFLIIFTIMVPSLLDGRSPLLISAGLSMFILAIAIYATHGFNRTSTSAFLGTTITIFITILLAELAVKSAHLTGYAHDASVYLNIDTGGTIDLQGILLGSIIIGVLGVLDDIAITQASVVREIKSAASQLSKKDVYRRALRVGREHVGALINTLALAYTGAALPLLLLFYGSESQLSLIMNREIFASEILRILVGSSGIILAVPITTALAVFMIKNQEKKAL